MSASNHFLTPHIQIQDDASSTYETLQQHHTTALSSLNEASKYLHHLNTAETAVITAQLHGLNQHAGHIHRVQAKLVDIHRRLRAIRARLNEVGIELDDEPDPVEELESEELRQIDQRRQEAKQRRLAAETIRTPPLTPTKTPSQLDG